MCLSDFSGCGAEFSKKRERAITTMTIGDENHRRRQIAMYIIETSIYKLPHQNEEHSSKRKEAAQILSWLVPKLTSVGSTLWLARAWQNRGDPPYSIISTLANPSEKSHRPRSRLIPVDFIGIFGNLATTTADTTGVTKREGRKVTVMPPDSYD